MTRRILVYGTLRRDCGAHRDLGNSKFVTETRVPGFKMVNLGGCPGIVEDKDNRDGIVGEMYELPEGEEGLEVLRTLDCYEGYRPHSPERSLYLRKEIDVNGTPADVYVFNRPTDCSWYQPIPSGDWSDR